MNTVLSIFKGNLIKLCQRFHSVVIYSINRSFFISDSATRKEHIMYFITVVLWMREERKKRRRTRRTWPGCIGGQRKVEDQKVPTAMLTTESKLKMK